MSTNVMIIRVRWADYHSTVMVVGMIGDESSSIVMDSAGRSDQSTFHVVATDIEWCTIMIGCGIKGGFLSSERKLPIKETWVPVNIARHNDMWKGLPFVISVWAHVQIGQSMSDMQREFEPIIGGNQLSAGVHSSRTFIDLGMVRFQLCR